MAAATTVAIASALCKDSMMVETNVKSAVSDGGSDGTRVGHVIEGDDEVLPMVMEGGENVDQAETAVVS